MLLWSEGPSTDRKAVRAAYCISGVLHERKTEEKKSEEARETSNCWKPVHLVNLLWGLLTSIQVLYSTDNGRELQHEMSGHG